MRYSSLDSGHPESQPEYQGLNRLRAAIRVTPEVQLWLFLKRDGTSGQPVDSFIADLTIETELRNADGQALTTIKPSRLTA